MLIFGDFEQFSSLISGFPKPEGASSNPVKRWLDTLEVRDPRTAHRLCKWIPSQCPFERNVQLWRWQFHIPALCKLNPFYEQLVGLRWRALSYLADQCGEDVTPYCR
jgi:hypothetical protein